MSDLFDWSAFDSEPTENEPTESESVEINEPDELTDEQIDAMFDTIADNLEQDEEVQKAIALAEEAQKEVEAAEEVRKGQEELLNKLHEQRKKIEQQLAELARQEASLKSVMWDANSAVRRATQKKIEADKQIDIAKQAVSAKRRYELLDREFLKRAKDKAWFKGVKQGDKTLKILEHQWIGAKYLASAERCILADGMGLGKTLTSIAALDLVESKRALVVAPADVVSNFAHEFRFWAPHRHVMVLKGFSKSERNTAIQMLQHLKEFVVIVNYEAWRRDLSLLEKFMDLQFDTVILDEAHNVKTTSSDAYKGCQRFILDPNVCPIDHIPLMGLGNGKMRKCIKCGWNGSHFDVFLEEEDRYANYEEKWHMSRTVKYVWTMTGTPILNHPGDLFSQLALIDPHNFDNRNEFLRMYCDLDPDSGRWTFRPGGLESLKKRLSGRYLGRTMHDAGIVLPEQKPILHEIEIDPEEYPDQLRVIKQLSKHAQIVLSDGRTIPTFAMIALITRQRQANVWPGGISLKDEHGNIIFQVSEEITESIKIDKAIDLIREFVEQGKRVALFSQFTTALAEIHNRINGMMLESGTLIRSVRFDGSTPDKLKEEIKVNFNKSRGEEAKWDVVLCNYKTGGVGLNLTAAEHTIILDEEWNPGKRDQAYARTHRMGQDKETFVHLLRIPRTIDTWMSGLIEEKEDMIGGFETETADIQSALLDALNTGEIMK